MTSLISAKSFFLSPSPLWGGVRGGGQNQKSGGGLAKSGLSSFVNGEASKKTNYQKSSIFNKFFNLPLTPTRHGFRRATLPTRGRERKVAIYE